MLCMVAIMDIEAQATTQAPMRVNTTANSTAIARSKYCNLALLMLPAGVGMLNVY